MTDQRRTFSEKSVPWRFALANNTRREEATLARVEPGHSHKSATQLGGRPTADRQSFP
jgi:hypothetical protein